MDSDLKLTDVIEIEHLQRIQDSFARATGVASIIIDLNGNTITRPSNFNPVCKLIHQTEEGRRRCDMSDQRRNQKANSSSDPFYHQCLSCGFVDASAPIKIGDNHVASWLIGQCNVLEVDRDDLKNYAAEIGADTDQMLRAFDDMPHMSLPQFKTVLELLFQIASEISQLGYNNQFLKKEIADRQEVEQVLYENEAKYRSVVEQSAENIFMVDVKTRQILEVNPAFCNLLGYSKEEILKLTAYDFIAHPKDDIDDKINRVLNETRIFLGERQYRRRDGRLVDVEVSVNMIEFKGRSAMCVVSRDITERKLAEKKLLEAYDDLEERVKERTRQLAEANEKLTFESEMLERKNVALKELLNHIEDGKKQLALQIQANIKKITLPILSQIENRISDVDRHYFNLLRKSLTDIASPFLNKLETQYAQLTPRELEICNLIKNDFSSKQIANSLTKSVQTVLKQRKMIRRKLGISGKKINLAAYLKKMN